MTAPLFAARQEQARAYARQRRWLALWELALGLSYLLFWSGSGLASWVRDLLPPYQPLRVAMMFLILAGGYGLLDLPFSFYGGFVLPRRYGLLVQSLRGWAWDLAKGAGISALLGLLVIEGLYGLLGASPLWWWVWGALFLFLLTVVLTGLAPLILVPLFFRMRPLADEALAARLTALARRVGTPVRGVYTLEMSTKTTTTNAALMGLRQTRRLVLGDSLLREYTPEEIETVVAHELAHQHYADIPRGILLQGVTTLAAFGLADQLLQRSLPALGYAGLDDVAAMPVVALVLAILLLLPSPLLRAYSRAREAAADRFALQATQNPTAFVSLMTKLADQNLAEHQPARWVELLFYDHPAPAKRIAAAQGLVPSYGGQGMRLILVRHGETAWNLEGRSQGSSDIALNERGRWQAARLAEALSQQDIAAVYASPLLRARETAATIAAARRIPVYLQDGLRELEQGLLEGMTPQEMWREYPELLQRWRTNAAETQLPQGESLGDLQQRTWAVVVRILAEHPKEMVLLVSHNLAIVTILCRALGISLRRFRRIRPSVASISTLEYRLGQWALMSFNDTCHLKDEGLGT